MIYIVSSGRRVKHEALAQFPWSHLLRITSWKHITLYVFKLAALAAVWTDAPPYCNVLHQKQDSNSHSFLSHYLGSVFCSPSSPILVPSSLSATSCPIPVPLRLLAMGRTEAPIKSVLNFTCDEGYVMIGANESHCLADGTWSHAPPLCKGNMDTWRTSCSWPRSMLKWMQASLVANIHCSGVLYFTWTAYRN